MIASRAGRSFQAYRRPRDRCRAACNRSLAFETLESRQVLATFVVMTDADSGIGSLREAVDLANSNPGLDVVNFDSSLAGLTITVSSAPVAVTDSLVIDASMLPQRVHIDSSPADPTPGVNDGNGMRAFVVDDGNASASSFVELRHLALQGGDVSGNGGAIISQESLVLDDVVLSDNHATIAGGAIHQTHGLGTIFQLQNSTVTGNTSLRGGALSLDQTGGNATVTHTYFGYNIAGQEGGAISAYTSDGAYFYVTDSTFERNSAGSFGGGLYLKTTGASTVLDGFSVSSNTAGSAGGGVFSDTTLSGSLEMQEPFFVSNQSGGRGGGWYGAAANDAQTTIENGSFFTNNADAEGGAISMVAGSGARTDALNIAIEGNQSIGAGGGLSSVSRDNAEFTLRFAVVGNNTAGPVGGGVYLHSESGGVNNVYSTPLTNNFGIRGGGIFAYAEANGIVRVLDAVANFNSAFAGGGGVYGFASTGGTVTLEGVMAHQNETLEEIGGGFAARVIQDGNVNIYDATVTNNRARFGGGMGLFLNQGAVNLETASIHENYAAGSGGGLAVQAFNNTTASIKGVTASNNEATSSGGGMWAVASSGTIEISSSTLSSNTAANSGGGIYASASPQHPNNVSLRHLTVSDNIARDNALTIGEGGGLASSSFSQPILSHSIIANNQVLGVPGDVAGNLVADYNLIEVPEAVTLTGPGNLTGIDPQLQPLADNGGPTLTHDLAATSPALNSGDPAFVGSPMFDQRGAPFARVVSGRIDRGALEVVPIIDGDFDDDGDHDLDDIDALVASIAASAHDLAFDLTLDGRVDLADRDAWLVEAGSMNLGPGRAYLVGDANLNGKVDGQDFLIWNSHKFTATARWSQGDWNADGTTDGGDFVLWNMTKFQNADEGGQRTVIRWLNEYDFEDDEHYFGIGER